MDKDKIISIINSEVEARKVKKNALAESSGINYTHLLKILEGNATPSIDKVIRILNQLDLELLVVHK